jgi:hypothetical protein
MFICTIFQKGTKPVILPERNMKQSSQIIVFGRDLWGAGI